MFDYEKMAAIVKDALEGRQLPSSQTASPTPKARLRQCWG
jgi:hypothetical protein